jgi:hypothetical protein
VVGSWSWVVDGGSVVRSRLVVDGSGVVRSRGRFVCGSGFVVDGSGGRLIDGSWGGFVCGSGVGFVCWGGVGSRLVFWVGCFTFVFHISNVALGASSVRNNLDTTVGKVDTVFSSGVIVITALLLAENWSVSGIVYSIFVVVHWGKDGLSSIRSRGGVVGSWGSSGDGRGNSQKAGGKSKLKTNLEVQSFKQFNSI